MSIPSVCLGEELHWVDENSNEVSDEKVSEFISNGFTDSIKKQAEENIPVLNKLKTCTPIERENMQIIGKEKDLCHFRYVDYDCFIPLDIAEEYAELGLKSAQEMLKGNINMESPEAKRIQEILFNEDYCSYKMTWPIMMEEADGEVFVEGVTIE